jgi:ABC-type polysaccharide/polyol phosphate transport system ATPase subunit
VEARISVRGLSKVFARHTATRRRGVTTEGAAALKHLLGEMRRGPGNRELPESGDKRRLAALDNVSFEAGAGEVLGIIGRNGAGKSTLLKILARVLHPTGGTATIHGRVVSMLELGIGFAPELTVRQNIQIHGRLAGIPPRRVRATEAEILEFAGLTAAADMALGSCPGGSAVQLGFAAVMCLGAEVVLADEVLAVGDSAFRAACEERVRAAGGSGETVLFVSHDMAAIRRICSRVVWIDRGRIVRDGPTDEVVDAYTNELLAGRLLPPLTTEGLAASCALLDTRLLDAARAQVGALQLTEPGYVDCLFRLSRPDVAASVEIEIWSGKQLVAATASPPVTARETTTFRAGVRIPADLLNEQTYSARFRLRVSGHRNGAAETAIAAEQRLEFAAMNPHPERSVWTDWTWGRGGLISPRLPWRVETDARAGRDATA